ncbi:DUF3311 domain-containing protein [Arthrobacter echini]|uniref:DUF3311 domain-containing protein n=1 Tax=Arthrobacter echini TaxID=1529066 RepID=A0A4S5E5L9_9MICC|nr:DUF3311 domain-containing protein [Arthrobacter echini]THJ66814.1 DUF3311 domain-containing protein [Arthrobacter echini]
MKKQTFTAIFTIVSVAAFLPLIFPLYSFANRETPIVLGFPFSFFWMILWVLIVVVAVIVLYFLDPERKQQEGDH